MGEALETRRLSDAAGRRPPGRLAAGFDLKASWLRAFWADERGATMVEYAILIGVLSFGIVAIFSAFETKLFAEMNKAAATIEAAIS
ncbi:Flp family type IVb pilin [Phenylobacterium aquaticum]|uniref:Flp family type IVb pilin n=1 Tax=Phenylobacterium aquaticum TaxID=1763816 RepID=UPI0026EA1FE1|nr:Flp family type IVb pilin [Phenylobacterium aquaticum]